MSERERESTAEMSNKSGWNSFRRGSSCCVTFSRNSALASAQSSSRATVDSLVRARRSHGPGPIGERATFRMFGDGDDDNDDDDDDDDDDDVDDDDDDNDDDNGCGTEAEEEVEGGGV